MVRGVNINKSLKINNKQLQSYLDNYLAREIRKTASAGEQALNNISKFVINEFYKKARNGHTYTSLPRALKTKQNNIRQDKDYVWCDIELYIDEGQYLAETESYYSIYNWVDRHNKSHVWGSRFVIWTQWQKGIVGLPSPHPHYNTGKLKLYMVDEIDRIWAKRTQRLLK